MVQMVNDESNKDESLNSTEPSENLSISYATQGVDLFDSEETDPAKSGAMREFKIFLKIVALWNGPLIIQACLL